VSDPRVPLAKAAAAAFAKYDSTVRTGGTPEQREWAFERYREAEDRLLAAEHKISPPKPIPRPAPSGRPARRT
jgi:hypothetical protein